MKHDYSAIEFYERPKINILDYNSFIVNNNTEKKKERN